MQSSNLMHELLYSNNVLWISLKVWHCFIWIDINLKTKGNDLNYILWLKYSQSFGAKRELVLPKVLRERRRERAVDPNSELSIFQFTKLNSVGSW